MNFIQRKSIWKELFLALALLGLVAGCASKAPVSPVARIHDADYYRANPMSHRELTRQWGEPLIIMELNRGVAQWIYPLPEGPVTGYQYFLVRKGAVFISGVWITDVSG